MFATTIMLHLLQLPSEWDENVKTHCPHPRLPRTPSSRTSVTLLKNINGWPFYKHSKGAYIFRREKKSEIFCSATQNDTI